MFLIERVTPDGRSCLLAHKRYRPREVTHKGQVGLARTWLYFNRKVEASAFLTWENQARKFVVKENTVWATSWWCVSVVTRSPRPRAGGPSPSGQHFLKDREFAAELVVAAGIAESDLVLEIGAGRGKLTEELGLRARKVLAIENDPALANLLVERFSGRGKILVVVGDAFSFPLPAERFRAFGNIPFGITTALFRHLLDDPTNSLRRADLIVQLGAAIKRARPRHSNLLNLSWGPWWHFQMTRHIPAAAFQPKPSVDAAMLTIMKRKVPVLPSDKRLDYLDLLHHAFLGNRELRVALKNTLAGSRFRKLANELAFHRDARATDLDLDQWIAVFRAVNSQG